MEFKELVILTRTRMHSSRMRTTCSSRHWGSASVHAGIHTPLDVGLETPQMWPWRPPPGGGLETPQARPLNFPLWCGRGDPPPGKNPQLPPGCGPGNLKDMLGYHLHPPGDLLQGMLGYHLQCMLGYHPPRPCE